MGHKILRAMMVVLIVTTLTVIIIINISMGNSYIDDYKNILQIHMDQLVVEINEAVANETMNEEVLRAFIVEKSNEINGRISILSLEGELIADSHVNKDTLYKFWLDTEISNYKEGQITNTYRNSSIFNQDTLYIVYEGLEFEKNKAIIRVGYPMNNLIKIRQMMIKGAFIVLLLEIMIFVYFESFLIYKSKKAALDMELLLKEVNQGQMQNNVYENMDLLSVLKLSQSNYIVLSELIEKTNERNSYINSLLLSINSGLVVVGNNKRILLINPAGEELLCVDKKVFLSHEIKNGILEKILSIADEILQNGGTKQLVEINEKGRILEIELSIISSKYMPYEQIGLLAVIRDITKMQKLEKMRKEFVSNVSHELRTPLTLISGFVETLKDWKNIDDEDRKKAFDIISIETDRLKRLVSELLRLSEIEHRISTVENTNVELVSTIENIIEQFSIKAEKKGCNIISKYDTNEFYYSCREDWLRQVFINLIENAIKYSPEDTTITVSFEVIENSICTSITNEGVGISKEDQKRIFERFYRVDKARNSKNKGSGLGLAIVKYIIKEMNGSIEVWSELNKGNKFTVNLPISKTEGV